MVKYSLISATFSPNIINCTSVISITDSFKSTDQMHNEDLRENTSGKQ